MSPMFEQAPFAEAAARPPPGLRGSSGRAVPPALGSPSAAGTCPEPSPGATVVAAGNFLSTCSPVAGAAATVRSAAPVWPLLATNPGEVPQCKAVACQRSGEPAARPACGVASRVLLSTDGPAPAFLGDAAPRRAAAPGVGLAYRPGETLARSALFCRGADGELKPLVGQLGSPVGSRSPAGTSQADTEPPEGSPGSLSDGDPESSSSSPVASRRTSTSPVASPVLSLTPKNPSVVIQLDDLVGPPAALPTVGSAAHFVGVCKPCAFVFKDGCASGADCKFCHLCQPGEKQRRQRGRRSAAWY